ncbi:hypothetical protein [Herbaspirillum sp. RV1423]|uniref:hypothetical protein n=1 Tax=Herbaspirillum sp. RV1423 TaxID=1443993 RepID=UPI0004BB2CF4|nr:hypothetical protein [Herbaspirillum sp. RV1423]
MRPEICVHFTGLLNECCRKGINYTELAGGSSFARFNRIPCTGKTGTEVNACDMQQLPTAEEVATDAAEWAAILARHTKVMPVVNEWKKSGPRGKQGTIDCPACGSKLHLMESAYNGHVTGCCETDGCVKWME